MGSNADGHMLEALLKKLDSMQKEISELKSSRIDMKVDESRGNKRRVDKEVRADEKMFKKALKPVIQREEENEFEDGFGDNEVYRVDKNKREKLKLKRLEELQQQYPEIGVIKLTINFDV